MLTHRNRIPPRTKLNGLAPFFFHRMQPIVIYNEDIVDDYPATIIAACQEGVVAPNIDFYLADPSRSEMASSSAVCCRQFWGKYASIARMPTFCGLSEAFPEATAAAAIVTVADFRNAFWRSSSLPLGPIFTGKCLSSTAAHKKLMAHRTGVPE